MQNRFDSLFTLIPLSKAFQEGTLDTVGFDSFRAQRAPKLDLLRYNGDVPLEPAEPSEVSIMPVQRLLITAAVFLSAPAFAQDEDEQKVVYKSRTEIDFEGVEVDGELVKPQGALLLDRKRANFNPLIKLRTDFDEEMDKSVDEVK